MTEIEFVDVNEWIEERYKKENNGLNFEEMVSGKDLRQKLWERKVRETRETYGENLFIKNVEKREQQLLVELPEIDVKRNLGILDLDIEKLKKSNIFPYGLTEDKIQRLKANGYQTVGQLAESPEIQLKEIYRIGDRTIERIKNVVDQAIWM